MENYEFNTGSYLNRLGYFLTNQNNMERPIKIF